MPIERDLFKIKRLGKERERENLEFRTFLKVCDVSSDKIDEIVHELYEKFSSEIDCKTCANCCKELSLTLGDENIKRVSKSLNITPSEFETRYVHENEWNEKILKDKPCPFLKNNLCQIFEVCPKDCREYPYIYKPNFTFRLLGVVENYSICPIVFNVYEALKRELWF